MGQYYAPVNMELKESIYTHRLDCGLKMGEILWSCYSVMDAIAIMLAYTDHPTQQPGDLYRDGVTGRWAGHPILFIGDYAEDGDLPTWRWPMKEDELWRMLPSKPMELDEDGVPYEFIEVSDFVRPVLEMVSGGAFYTTESRWRDQDDNVTIHTKWDWTSIKSRGDGGYTVEIPADANQWVRQSLEAAIPQVEARTDLTPLLEDEIGVGQRRLIVNLDKGEFLDPRKFDEEPTLAGLSYGVKASFDKAWAGNQWNPPGMSCLQSMCAMLFHNGRRGGGDDEGPTVSRWRGDRLVILGEHNGSRFPTMEQVEGGFEDISEMCRQAVPA